MKKFRLRREESYCHCNHDCSCEADVSYILEVDGVMGFGRAVWVLDPKTNEEMFACSFFGWEFTAKSDVSMQKELEYRLNMIRDEPVTVEVW